MLGAFALVCYHCRYIYRPGYKCQARFLTVGFGDIDFVRREVTFVDWVRDRADADVHVLVTSQRTASGGGRAYQLAFLTAEPTQRYALLPTA